MLDLDIKMLKVFDLLYSRRSVSAVAREMSQAQPTVSIWLGKLRREFGDQLFVKTLDGMEPTPGADALIASVREALEVVQRLSTTELTFDPSNADRLFRICMTDASHVTLLPTLLGAVRASAPSVRLEALPIGPTMRDTLKSGEADIALGLFPDLGTSFQAMDLFSQDWVCMGGPDAGLDDDLTVAEYQELNHITISGGTGGHLLEAALKRSRIDRKVRLHLPGFLGLGAIASSSDLVTTLPRHSGETLAAAFGLTLVRCPFPIDGFCVKQVWHSKMDGEPGNKWLRALVKSLFHATPNGRPAKARAATEKDRTRAGAGPARKGRIRTA